MAYKSTYYLFALPAGAGADEEAAIKSQHNRIKLGLRFTIARNQCLDIEATWLRVVLSCIGESITHSLHIVSADITKFKNTYVIHVMVDTTVEAIYSNICWDLSKLFIYKTIHLVYNRDLQDAGFDKYAAYAAKPAKRDIFLEAPCAKTPADDDAAPSIDDDAATVTDNEADPPIMEDDIMYFD
jgi:hypothetical protein